VHFSASGLIADFVAVLVGLTSSAVIVFQAARTLHATTAEVASWMCAVGRIFLTHRAHT